MTTNLPVVVGIDDLPVSTAGIAAAIETAAFEAARRHVGLRLVCGYQMLTDWTRTGNGTLAADQASRIAIVDMLNQTVAAGAATYPDLEVTGAVLPGSAANALVTASQTATLVVVAADARVHYGGIAAGFVSVQVAAHAHTSVLVVPQTTMPPTAETTRRVVIGIDASPATGEAVAFAFDEASARGASVHAVHTWDLPTRHGLRPLGDRHADRDALQSGAERMLADATGCWQEKFPDVPVICDAVRSPNPVRVLNDAAVGADMLVVGRRGLGGFETLLLGSVSDGLVRYCRTTVAVIHAAPTGDSS